MAIHRQLKKGTMKKKEEKESIFFFQAEDGIRDISV